ncbi:MAG: rod-binding protein, partial [Phycisphaerales bacterium]|nr:rod-binding protein [Phycisphaerales bacterium]
STTFIEPILKQMRESNNTPPPFGPGKAEKQFATLLDTQLADKIVHAANFPLVQRITNDILRNMPADPAAPQTPKQTLDIKG